MISPSSIAVAATAGNLAGKESSLFRFTVKHSFIMLAFVSLIVLAQAYVFSWIIPSYNKTGTTITSVQDTSQGYIYLLLLVGIILAIAAVVVWTNRKRRIQT
jgi:lactate permease